ncbi:MAG: AAA family ATPase [Allosphingosinicella sp.]
MKLVFIYGQIASGKLTVARELAARTGLPLFHNHLIVDAVAAVFPFGSDAFVRLREQFWLATFAEAARERRSLLFTFAPEPTVSADFPDRVRSVVSAAGGEVCFVRLTVPTAEQLRRLALPDRLAFGKLGSPDLLRQLRPQLEACEAAMPEPRLVLDTGALAPAEAAARIVRGLALAKEPRES